MLISLFITCYNDTLFPQTGKAVVAVLERLGHVVEFRRQQTCCGQMHYNTGYHVDAASLMRDFVRVFQDAEVICAPSASCVAMIRDHYPKMAAASGDAALVTAVAEVVPRVYEFTELLVDRLGVTDVGASYPHRVTLHTSCHGLRGLHLTDQPVRLLQAVRGLELVDLPRNDECCGFGGTFAIKNADVSSAMVAEKIACVLETRAEVCTATENSCLMQIAGVLNRRGAAVRCMHLAEILASRRSERPSPGGNHRGEP
jgi:L-lactate dehydrogenase complex protein LldE